MATSLSTCGPPSNTWFLGPTAHNPVDRFSRFCTEVSLYFTVRRPSPSKMPLPMGDLDPLSKGCLGPLESSAQTAYPSVQPFLQGSLVWQTDRPRYSDGNNKPHRMYVHSTAMRPNNDNVVMTTTMWFKGGGGAVNDHCPVLLLRVNKIGSVTAKLWRTNCDINSLLVNTQFCKHTSVAGKRARMLPCQIRLGLTLMHTGDMLLHARKALDDDYKIHGIHRSYQCDHW